MQTATHFKHIPVKNRPLKMHLAKFLLSLLDGSSNKQKVVSTALYGTEQATTRVIGHPSVQPGCQDTGRLHYVKVYGVW